MRARKIVLLLYGQDDQSVGVMEEEEEEEGRGWGRGRERSMSMSKSKREEEEQEVFLVEYRGDWFNALSWTTRHDASTASEARGRPIAPRNKPERSDTTMSKQGGGRRMGSE